jgi:hypothetical protein
VWFIASAVAACGSEEGCKSGLFGVIVGIAAAVAVTLLIGRLLFTRRGRASLSMLLSFFRRRE